MIGDKDRFGVLGHLDLQSVLGVALEPEKEGLLTAQLDHALEERLVNLLALTLLQHVHLLASFDILAHLTP